MIFNRIKDMREDKEYKQIELANCLCVKQSTYSDYENGKINIPIEAFVRLADFYNTSIDYLVGRTDVREAYPARRTKKQ